MPALLLAAALLAQAPSAAPAPEPSPEAVALGERLSRAGTLGGIVRLAGGEEAKGVLNAHRELDPAARARAEVAADRALSDAVVELTRAEGRALASALTPAQLQAAAAFFESPEGQAYRAAFPRVLIAMTQTGPARDFKGYITGRICDEAQVCPRGGRK